MSRYIDADALREKVLYHADTMNHAGNHEQAKAFNYCLCMIDDMPTVSINDEPYTYRQPVKNKWLKRIDNDCQMLECPKCECRVLATDYSFAVGNKGYSFCPYCGADLREETDV